MKPASAFCAIILFAGLVTPASAHSPFPGAGDFYNGMLHPLLVPAYLLAIISLGLLFGQHAPVSSQYAMPAFALTLVTALCIPPATSEPIPQSIMLGFVFVAGFVVAASLNVGVYLSAIFGTAIGGLIGMNSKLDALAEGLSWLSLAGSALGAVLAVVALGGTIATLRRRWQRIGVRVLGSWTAASAFLVIALTIASPNAGG